MHATLVPWTSLGAGHESLDSEHMNFLCCLALTAASSTNNMHCLGPDAPFSQSQPSISSLCFDPSRRRCRYVHRSAITEQEALIDVELKSMEASDSVTPTHSILERCDHANADISRNPDIEVQVRAWCMLEHYIPFPTFHSPTIYINGSLQACHATE